MPRKGEFKPDIEIEEPLSDDEYDRSPFTGVPDDGTEGSVDMSHPRGVKTRNIRIEKRMEYALRLRRQGASMRQIAQQISSMPEFEVPGYSAGNASGDITKELSRIRAETTSDAMLLRQLELERLDELQSRFWTKALAGDYLAADKVLSIMDRRAKYLGLHEPTRYEINIEWDKLSRTQTQRIADGEDPYSVIMDAEYTVTVETPKMLERSDSATVPPVDSAEYA